MNTDLTPHFEGMSIPALPALLKLLTWLSPSYPVGAFAYSHGLEAAHEAGLVTDEPSLERYVRSALEHGCGSVDAAVFAGTWRAVTARNGQDLVFWLERGGAMRSAAELAAESELQGEAFWRTVRAASGEPGLAWAETQIAARGSKVVYPCAVASACASAPIPLAPALAAFLHAFVANLVSAGVRLIPLGQTAGQRIMERLAPSVAAAAEAAIATPFEDVGTSSFLLDIFTMTHETQYTRLFRS